MEGWFTADPRTSTAIRSGRQTELRVPVASPLAALAPGARIGLREACIPGRRGAAGEVTTALAAATFVCFPDGERVGTDGTRWQGKPPRDAEEQWVAALHMPAWATRAVLTVRSVRTERLDAINRSALAASGWRGLLRKRGFIRHWNTLHPVPGLRWADKPAVAVLSFTI
jgi:hypothetical protein